MVFKTWLKKEPHLERVSGAKMFFVKRNTNGTVYLMMVKLTVDVVTIGPRRHLKESVGLFGKKLHSQICNR